MTKDLAAIQESLKSLTVKKAGGKLAIEAVKAIRIEVQGENQKINKAEILNNQVDRRKFNKGVVGKAGRKPKEATLLEEGIKKWMSEHVNSNATFEYKDPKTGETKMVTKPRLVWALERLFEIGMGEKDPDALDKWLNRILGRPAQVIKGDEDEPIMLKLDI